MWQNLTTSTQLSDKLSTKSTALRWYSSLVTSRKSGNRTVKRWDLHRLLFTRAAKHQRPGTHRLLRSARLVHVPCQCNVPTWCQAQNNMDGMATGSIKRSNGTDLQPDRLYSSPPKPEPSSYKISQLRRLRDKHKPPLGVGKVAAKQNIWPVWKETREEKFSRPPFSLQYISARIWSSCKRTVKWRSACQARRADSECHMSTHFMELYHCCCTECCQDNYRHSSRRSEAMS